ncbi:MAG: type I methionyl aminopeptidase [Nitrospiraceae bacterium]|nr:type I methionyl aminopeptidase [Nitrospiraceae bacterium]
MILIKGSDEIAWMAEAGRIVAETFEAIKDSIAPDVSTEELDRLASDFILKKGGEPAFKGYRGYPATMCSSINEQVVHGIPSGRRLKQGDIVSVDLGVRYKGFYGDAAVTYAVGGVSPAARTLMRTTEEALWLGIAQAVEGNRVSDIAHAIQKHAEGRGFSIVRSFVGHGIGRSLHEEPQVPNFGPPGKGPRLLKGMALAIEPMVNAGGWQVKILDDGWTAVTADGSLSAHYEHTIVVTGAEPLVLTKLP